MAGTVITDVVQSSISGTPPQFNDGNGTQTGTLCRAWVNFNGSGTVAIRASFNVSSITDNGTGNYTVNFTSALSDANYAPVVSLSFSDTAASPLIPVINGNGLTLSAPTSSAFRFTTYYYNAAAPIDTAYINVSVFR